MFSSLKSQQIKESIKIYFKPDSYNFNHSSKSLDSLLSKIDSLVKKELIILVTAIGPTSEIKSKKYIHSIRAQKIIDLYKKKYQTERGIFYINVYGHTSSGGDFFLQGKSWVSFRAFRSEEE